MYKLNEDVLWNEVEGTITVLISSSGKYYEFNKLGAEIFKLLVKEKSKPEIIETLSTKYNVPKFKIKIDTALFIENLLKKNIFEES